MSGLSLYYWDWEIAQFVFLDGKGFIKEKNGSVIFTVNDFLICFEFCRKYIKLTKTEIYFRALFSIHVNIIWRNSV